MIVFSENRRWFRLLLFVTMAILLASFTLAFSPHVASAQETTGQEESPFSPAVVTATTTANLNLREGPGTEHAILATLPAGTIVGFTGFTDGTRNWVQVDSAISPVGWVSAVFLSNVPADLQVRPADLPAEPEIDPAVPAFGPEVVTATTTANLNLREGPGTEFPVLTTLSFGTVVGFTGFTDGSGNWVQVDSPLSPVGWVSAAFLSNVPADLQVRPADLPPEEPVTEPAEPHFSPAVVTATTTANLNLREGPGTEHAILATLPAGTVVGFTGFTDGTRNWVQVDSAISPVGWVSAAFLSNVPAELQVRPADLPPADD